MMENVTMDAPMPSQRSADNRSTPNNSNIHANYLAQIEADKGENDCTEQILRLKTARQIKIFNYLYTKRDLITSYNELQQILEIPVGTIKHTLKKLETHGFLTKRKHYGPNNEQGLHILLDNSKRTDQLKYRIFKLNRPNPHSNILRDIKNEICLSQAELNLEVPLTEEDLRANYPALFALGFRTNQIRQITKNLIKNGITTANLRIGLEHANAWLELGNLVDGKGEEVKSPKDYIFTSLHRTGYYSKPRGYISPEEQAAKDAEERADAARKAIAINKQMEFESWEAGLPAEELKQLMEGQKGPKEQWLKRQYEIVKKRHT